MKMSTQQLSKLRIISTLMNTKTKPVKKQGRISKTYRQMHEHYIQVITELNAQKEVNRLALEVIIEVLEGIKKNHPLFF